MAYITGHSKMDISYLDIFNNLVKSFKNAFDKTGASCVIIGLSGGVDSALVAGIITEALGKDKVRAFFMPYKTSSKNSYDDALKVYEKYGFNLEVINISPMADVFFENLNNLSDLRKGNIMARVRMITLFDKAAEHNGIVAGTSNRTELLLGYGTWYGDTASSINLLGELYKRDVYGISRAIGIPESIIEKAPTADLWQEQTDEKELGFTYEMIDNILYDIEQNKLSKDELYKKYDRQDVDSIIKRVINNTFKRHTPFICESGVYKGIDESVFTGL